MGGIIIDILPIALLITFLYKAHPVKPLSSFNQNYLSVKTGKCFKGLFALVVIFHHLAQRTQTGILFRYFSIFGYLAVAVFFFFSGYGLQKSYITKQDKYKKRFLLRRLPGILIPYIFITALYWLMNCAGGYFYSIKDLAVKIINGAPIDPNSWYIITIIAFYISYWIFMLICRNNYKIMIALACIWNVLYVAYCIKMQYGKWWYNTSHLLIIGMVWAVYEDRIIAAIKKSYKIIMPLVWLSFAFFFVLQDKIALWIPIAGISLLVDIITTVLFVTGIILFSMKIQIGNKILSFLGDISLEMYLVHGMFITALRNNMIFIQNELIWCILVLSATIILSFVLHFIFAKLLFRKKKA